MEDPWFRQMPMTHVNAKKKMVADCCGIFGCHLKMAGRSWPSLSLNLFWRGALNQLQDEAV